MEHLKKIQQEQLLPRRPEQRMSDSARRLHQLKRLLSEYQSDRRYDKEAYTTEFQLREQAAFLIGFLV
jgi:hypothetical protein